MRIPKMKWLWLGLCVAVPVGLGAEELIVRWQADQLRVSATNLRILAGKSLERLKNGVAVIFDFQLTLWTGNRSTVSRRASERHAVSYDLWEEKFSVTQVRSPRRSASHLTAAAAEAWCLESLTLPATGLSADTNFWLRLEVSAEDAGKDQAVVEPSGINLTGLIERMSRSGRAPQERWTLEAGPLRLQDVKR